MKFMVSAPYIAYIVPEFNESLLMFPRHSTIFIQRGWCFTRQWRGDMNRTRRAFVPFVLASAVFSGATFAAPSSAPGQVISNCAPDCVRQNITPVRVRAAAPEIDAGGAGGALAFLVTALLIIGERVHRQ